jgi:hypothetical protein
MEVFLGENDGRRGSLGTWSAPGILYLEEPAAGQKECRRRRCLFNTSGVTKPGQVAGKNAQKALLSNKPVIKLVFGPCCTGASSYQMDSGSMTDQ